MVMAGIIGDGMVITTMAVTGIDLGVTIAGIIGAGAVATVIMDFMAEVSMVEDFMLHITITIIIVTIITATEAMHDRMAEEATIDLVYIATQL